MSRTGSCVSLIRVSLTGSTSPQRHIHISTRVPNQ
nr:MAG TPA: hypothetical protein [Caudoviricetes sp.]